MKKLLLLLTVFLFVLTACQTEKPEDETAKETETNQTTKTATMDKVDEGIMQVTNPWIRPAGKGRNTALFFRVVNDTNEGDSLISARSDLSEKVEVHETFEKGADMMGMREVEYVEIAAGKVTEFKPMDFHVMLIGLTNDLTEGDSGEVTLVFKNKGEVKVTAPVKDNMPTMKAAKEQSAEKTE